MWPLWVAGALAGELRLEVRTVDFLLSENLDRALVPALTRLHAMHEDWLGASLPSLLPLEVRLVADGDTFGRVETTQGEERAERIGTYEHAAQRVTVWYRSDEEARRVVLHEAGHFLAHRSGRSGAPPWLTEGLAEVGANLSVDDRGRVWLEPDRGAMSVLGRRPRPAASALVGLDEATWSSLGVVPEYPYGWALCAFFLASEAGRATLAAVLDATAGSDDPGRAALAAIERRFPGGVAGMDQGFASWTPSRVEVPPRYTGPASDGWGRCPDGSLVRLGAGVRCGRWLAGRDGVMRYVEEDPAP